MDTNSPQTTQNPGNPSPQADSKESAEHACASEVANDGLPHSSPPTPIGSRELGGGFSLTAFTPRGVSMLDALENVLATFTTPHGDSL